MEIITCFEESRLEKYLNDISMVNLAAINEFTELDSIWIGIQVPVKSVVSIHKTIKENFTYAQTFFDYAVYYAVKHPNEIPAMKKYESSNGEIAGGFAYHAVCGNIKYIRQLQELFQMEHPGNMLRCIIEYVIDHVEIDQNIQKITYLPLAYKNECALDLMVQPLGLRITEFITGYFQYRILGESEDDESNTEKEKKGVEQHMIQQVDSEYDPTVLDVLTKYCQENPEKANSYLVMEEGLLIQELFEKSSRGEISLNQLKSLVH